MYSQRLCAVSSRFDLAEKLHTLQPWSACPFWCFAECLSYRYEKHPSIAVMLCTKSERCFFDIPCHSFLKCCLSALSVCCHKPLMPTEIPLFIVQMKTRDTPCQMYSGAISTIPKATTLVTSQPTLHSTQIEIDGTTVFRLDISIHFKTVIRVWPHQVKCFFCNSTFIYFPYVCICFYSSFLNLKVTSKQYLDLFFISSNLSIMLKTIKRILYSFTILITQITLCLRQRLIMLI